MREYGQVQTGFWAHPEMADLDDPTRLMALYCFTCPHSNALGCYRLPPGYAAADLGWSEAEVARRLETLHRVGLVLGDADTGWVLVPNHLRWNPIQNPNVGKAVLKQLRRVPDTFAHRDRLVQALRRWGRHLPVGWETFAGVEESYGSPGENRQRVAALRQQLFGPQGEGGDQHKPNTAKHRGATT